MYEAENKGFLFSVFTTFAPNFEYPEVFGKLESDNRVHRNFAICTFGFSG